MPGVSVFGFMPGKFFIKVPGLFANRSLCLLCAILSMKRWLLLDRNVKEAGFTLSHVERTTIGQFRSAINEKHLSSELER